MFERLSFFDGLSLRLNIDHSVAVGRGNTSVAQPLADREYVDNVQTTASKPRARAVDETPIAHFHPLTIRQQMWSSTFLDKDGWPDIVANLDIVGNLDGGVPSAIWYSTSPASHR